MATLFRHNGNPKDAFRLSNFHETRAKYSCYSESILSSQGRCLANRHLEHSIVYDNALLGYLESEEPGTPKIGHASAGLLDQKGKFDPRFKCIQLSLVFVLVETPGIVPESPSFDGSRGQVTGP
jgi:hypothetical protein